MPSGQKPGYVPRAAIAAAARLKTETMLKSLATGKRRCPRCGLAKTLAEFNKSKSQPSGLHGWRRACNRVNHREWERRKREREHALAAEGGVAVWADPHVHQHALPGAGRRRGLGQRGGQR